MCEENDPIVSNSMAPLFRLNEKFDTNSGLFNAIEQYNGPS